MAGNQGFHEDLKRTHAAEQASPRSFGALFAVVFAIIALAPLLTGGDVRWWSLITAVVFGALALIAPALLQPLNAVWLKIGAVLHMIVTPLVMGVLFVVAVVPTALMVRLLGKDSLRLKRDPAKTTHWIDREPPGPEPESLRQQF